MKCKNLSLVFVLFVCMAVAGLSGCSSGSSSDSVIDGSSEGNDDSSRSILLSTYGESVKACTPYLESSAKPADSEDEVSGEETGTIDVWGGWDPSVQHTVFRTLLSTDSEWEGIYCPVENTDRYVRMINSLSHLWDSSGTTEDVAVSVDGKDLKVDVAVAADLESVNVPFFAFPAGVDRSIEISGEVPDEENSAFVVKVFFSMEGGDETIVVRDYHPGSGEVRVTYGHKSGDTGTIDLWFAGYTEEGTPEDVSNDFACVFKWRGNPDEGWFALAQFTNAAEDSWVLAGGEEGLVTFSTRRVNQGELFYYVITTTENIQSGAPEAVTVYNTTDDVPIVDTEYVLGYIVEGLGNPCLGLLAAYPLSTAELDW